VTSVLCQPRIERLVFLSYIKREELVWKVPNVPQAWDQLGALQGVSVNVKMVSYQMKTAMSVYRVLEKIVNRNPKK
jgi:hypothetical protein